MADVLSPGQVTSPPDEFVEALNGLVVGIVSLEFVRRSLAGTLEENERSANRLRSLIEAAYQDGRLGTEDYEILSGDLCSQSGEDVPTEWSEEITNAATADAAAETDARASGLYPGAVLRERFVLQSRLHASDMSELYKALDRQRQESGSPNPWLAIKLVSPSNKHYAQALELLEREAEIARQLQHPNIVHVFDFDRDGEHAFITLEWLEGESLGDLLTRQRYRPLTLPRARQITVEIASALHFAHARGITHADVKPGNIFLTGDGTAKLLDFGVARSAADTSRQGGADARTPAYASCEVIEGQEPTPQDDVYSLACVAYRMLAGRRAFSRDDALTAEASGRRLAPIHGLSKPQWDALARALAYRRPARTPDVATFIREFNPRPQAPVAPVPAIELTERVAPSEPERRRTRPHGIWVGLAAAVAGAMLTLSWLPAGEPGRNAPMDFTAPEPAVQSVPGNKIVTASVPTVAPAPAFTPTDADATARPRRAATTIRPPPARVTTAGVARDEIPTAPGAPAGPDAFRPEAADAPVIAATEPVALNGALLLSPARPDPTRLQASAGIAMPGEVPAPPAAEPPAGGMVQAATAEPGRPGPRGPQTIAGIPIPDQVPLSSFKFRRYVEPIDRPLSRGRDPIGWVELSFIVDADGRTRDITVVSASPPDEYEDAALAAVKRWRFEPVREGGRAVERRTAVRLRFEPK